MGKVKGSQKELLIFGQTYIIQHPGLRERMRMCKRCCQDGYSYRVEKKKLNEEIMKHVLIYPKTNADYWKKTDGFEELMEEIYKFLGIL
ncbi:MULTISPECIES: hypothetical protein [Bacteria]|uniref:hypothetical protein n=1 Tax=Bacteria TaxID=2 RepID=UPI0007D75ADB